MSTLTDRMIRAAKLDVGLYEEVEADENALGQAMAVVVLSSLAAGIGSLSWGIGGLISGAAAAVVGWFIWAFITFLIGTKLLPEAETKATYGELLKAIGFSSSPGLIRVFAIIPFFGWLVMTIASIWMLVAMVIAVRQALDYRSVWRAVGVCLVGWIIQGILFAVFLSPFMGAEKSG